MNRKLMLAAATSVLGFGVLGACTPQSKQQYSQAGQELGGAAQKIGTGLKEDTQVAGAQAADATMTGKVKAALIAAKDVDSSHIDVDTSNKVVMLKGSVPDQAQSEKAQQIAADQAGAGYSVQNELQVGLPQQQNGKL
jgi:hyperosmotically inducible protein